LHIRWFFKILLFCLWALSSTLWAQPDPTATPVNFDSVEAQPEVAESFASPRASLQAFLELMEKAGPLRPDLYVSAARHLDMSYLPVAIRDQRLISLTGQLYSVLLAAEIDFHKVPEECAEEVIRIYRQPDGENIALKRGPDGRWVFSAETLEALPQMQAVLAAKGRLATWDLPDWLEFNFLGVSGLHWLFLTTVPFLSWCSGRLGVGLLRRILRSYLESESFGIPAEQQKRVLRPVGWLIGSLICWLGFSVLMLPDSLLLLVALGCKFVATSSAVLTAYHLCDLVSLYLKNVTSRTQSTFDDMLVPLLRRTLKTLVTILGILFIAQNLDLEVWSLFAGFSVVGAMVALAGQDLVKNFFGSLTVILDRPFSVGDWVVVEGIEGVVEDVGFRSTRIRTFYDSLISLPNSRLITAHVDNYGVRKFRRYTTKLNLKFGLSAEQLESFCEGIRQLILSHRYTRKEAFQVWVNDLSEYSLQVLLYVFWKVPDWTTELQERHRLLVDIQHLAAQLEIEFAYPTQSWRGQLPTTNPAEPESS